MKPHPFSVLAALALSLIPHVVLAQATTTGATGCGTFGTAFNGMIQATNAFQTFFYGPFFKVGCLAAFAIAAVVLLMDDGQLGRIGQLILRGILLVAFVLGAASFLNVGSTTC
jgi:hypothetical protein